MGVIEQNEMKISNTDFENEFMQGIFNSEEFLKYFEIFCLIVLICAQL